jgi:hypothetical protein
VPGEAHGPHPQQLLQVALDELEWDRAKGAVVGDDEANRLLRRPYRAPWVHPEPGNVQAASYRLTR